MFSLDIPIVNRNSVKLIFAMTLQKPDRESSLVTDISLLDFQGCLPFEVEATFSTSRAAPGEGNPPCFYNCFIIAFQNCSWNLTHQQAHFVSSAWSTAVFMSNNVVKTRSARKTLLMEYATVPNFHTTPVWTSLDATCHQGASFIYQRKRKIVERCQNIRI